MEIKYSNILEYWSKITKARSKQNNYFLKNQIDNKNAIA